MRRKQRLVLLTPMLAAALRAPAALRRSGAFASLAASDVAAVDETSRKRRHPDYKRPYEPPEETWPRYPNFSFKSTTGPGGTLARTGKLSTPHGDVETPAFIFCATKAAIKGATAEQMKACGTQIILSNTYHLLVQPGPDLIEKMGGLQKCTGWGGPMLTDSGGYQIFSLGHGSVSDEIKGRRFRGAGGKGSGSLAGGGEGENGHSASVEDAAEADRGRRAAFEPTLLSIGERGARIRSYHDGCIHLLTPESSVETQRKLGADLIVVLDECTPFHVDKDYTQRSMERSHRWALRSLAEFMRGNTGRQALYGIVQGGVYPDLRSEAAEFCNRWPFFGIAVGGSLGADKRTMYDVVESTMKQLRRDRPVHLLGVGGIADIFHGVRCGIDTFDCVHPTRLGRHGGALVKASFWEEGGGRRAGKDGGARPPRESIQLSKGEFKDDMRVIDEGCGCPTCRGGEGYSRAYLHHLLKAGETLGGTLVVLHNVFFMNKLCEEIRRAIPVGELDAVEKEWLAESLRPANRVLWRKDMAF